MTYSSLGSTEPEFLAKYFSRVSRLVAIIDAKQVAELAASFNVAIKHSKHIFFIGNGGSAATASHYVNDLVMACARSGRVVRTSSLTDNVSIVTGVANDYSFLEIFEYQLRVLAQPGDLVVAISASGNSPNLVRAIEYARGAGLNTAAVLGFEGGKLRELAGIVVHVPTETGEYGPSEDAHLVINHAIAALLSEQSD